MKIIPLADIYRIKDEKSPVLAKKNSKKFRSYVLNSLLVGRLCQWQAYLRCPLYPQKRTSELSRGMSALCQKRTHAPQQKASIRSPHRRSFEWSWARRGQASLR